MRRDGRVTGVRFKDGTELAGRPGRDGRRHPAQHRARREGAACTATAASSSTTPCRPIDRAHLRGRRMRAAPRHRLRPGRAAVRAGQGLRQPSRAVRHRPLRRLADLDQAQGHRHRPVLRRRFHAAATDTRRDRAAATPTAASTRSSCSRTTSWSAPAVRRHRRRQLVLQAAARRPQRSATSATG